MDWMISHGENLVCIIHACNEEMVSLTGFLGADITDYFNYGFNEVTWRAYCAQQKMIRESRKVKEMTWSMGSLY